ncbi:MAG: glycoside hydrolase family 2 protein [Ignavibacteriales bacterium]|nr:MAG: glycoside hydrolase family 2 protein [Ignavibacteriales bacterium]
MRKKIDLSADWKFNVGKENPTSFKINDWLSANIPGTIHTDLLKHKLIDDPFYNDNEKRLEWICTTDWTYKTVFNKPKDYSNDLPVFLVFEGIETIAEIFLNSSLLGKSENMFLKYEFDVSSLIKEKENILEVNFKSPLKYAKGLEEKYGKLPVALNSERVYIRKAQYSFGWDWGPSFPTMGIWRPVYLEQRDKIFIESFSFTTKEINNNNAILNVKIKLNDKTEEELSLEVLLVNEEQKYEKKINTNAVINEIELEIKNPKLWWPNGEGEQNLYNLEINLLADDKNFDSLKKKIGIRTINLQLKENNKPTFKFLINGKQIFAKGVNWIPADSFLPRVTNEKYEGLLKLAIYANMNFVRVWGGGFYENDIFYELCDELGLLVWQDFMFACASYPENEEFLENIKEEIKQNVQRLQYHPSLAIWCGNNENEWIWFQEMKTSYKEMPGYKIYHDLIPKILQELNSSSAYWPSSPFNSSSPFSSDEDPNSYTSGNRHEWGIWSKWIDYSEVKNDSSLFVTEFGFQGPANKKTFEKYLSEENRNTQNKVFEFHNKQVEGQERIFKFLAGNLPVKTDWDDFIYLAQLNQALALKTCLEHWRMNWPLTNGSIIWQINDCWPVTSWSIIDSELQPKISYHFVKNIFNRKVISFKRSEDQLKLTGLNQTDNESTFIIDLQVYRDRTGELISQEKIEASLESWSKKEIHKMNLKDIRETDDTTIVASLIDNDKVLFRNFYSEQKWKYKILSFPQINIKMKDDKTISVNTDAPAFFVDLFHPGYEFSERGFILLPGEEKELKIMTNLNQPLIKEEIKIFSLNHYLRR